MTKTNKRKMAKKKLRQPRKRKRKLQDDVSINFFSVQSTPNQSMRISKRQRKIRVPYNLGFLNGAVPKRPVVARVTKEKMSFFTPVKMNTSSYYKKESTNQIGPLIPLGDADLDGSPNMFDCNPRQVSEDGIFARALGMLTGGKYGQSKEDYQIEKANKGQSFSKFAKQETKVIKKSREAFQARKKAAKLAEKRIKEISKKEGIKLTPLQTKKLKEEAWSLLHKQQKKDTEWRLQNPTMIEKVGSTIGEGIEKVKRGLAPLRSAEGRALASLDAQILRAKALASLDGPKAKGKGTYKLEQKRNKLQRIITEKKQRFQSGVLTALTPLGAVPEIQSLSRVKGRAGVKQGRGRPRGPSGKYMVDGQPVSEGFYQKVKSVENRKRMALGMEKVHSGERTIYTVKQAVPQRQASRAVTEAVQPSQESRMPQQEFAYKGGEAVPEELYDSPQQQVQLQPQRRQMTVQEAQMQEQQDDNILKAPSFQKGELQQTGGVFQSDPQYNILNAPNFQKGGLRNVGATEETQIVSIGERPQPNPYGDEYTEIDPGSGRVMVKRRPREKWATGEAL